VQGGSLPNTHLLFSNHERIYGNLTYLAPRYSSSYINRYERHKARTRNDGDQNIAVRNNGIRHNFRSFPDTRYVSKYTIKNVVEAAAKTTPTMQQKPAQEMSVVKETRYKPDTTSIPASL